MKKVTLFVEKIISSPSALTVEQGKMLFDAMDEVLSAGDAIILDFDRIESMITPFLNASIGTLYGKFDWDEIGQKVEIINNPKGTNRKFNMVISNAKLFYKNQEAYNKIVEDVLTE